MLTNCYYKFNKVRACSRFVMTFVKLPHKVNVIQILISLPSLLNTNLMIAQSWVYEQK